MANTQVKFVSPKRVTVQTSQGDRLTLGLTSVVPTEFQHDEAELIAALFDKYYKGDPKVIDGPILRGMYQYGFRCGIYWHGADRNEERQRVGAQIRSLREERRMDVRELAGLADLDPSNLNRIEMGKFAPNLDILGKIATALDCHIEFVPDSNRVDMNSHVYPDNKQAWIVSCREGDFRISDCISANGGFHWCLGDCKANHGDIVYVYIEEEDRIVYRMEVTSTDQPYDMWIAQEEPFWVDRVREDSIESGKLYTYLQLYSTSRRKRLTKQDLMEAGVPMNDGSAFKLDDSSFKHIKRLF